MSDFKGTPGPWFTSQPHGTIYIEARLRGSTLQEVAACGPTETPDQREANAKLIAMSPQLLLALVDAVTIFRGLVDGVPSLRQRVEAYDNLIAKATE
ncbi:hypothetical protein [Pseudomonas mohnii]